MNGEARAGSDCYVAASPRLRGARATPPRVVAHIVTCVNRCVRVQAVREAIGPAQIENRHSLSGSRRARGACGGGGHLSFDLGISCQLRFLDDEIGTYGEPHLL